MDVKGSTKCSTLKWYDVMQEIFNIYWRYFMLFLQFPLIIAPPHVPQAPEIHSLNKYYNGAVCDILSHSKLHHFLHHFIIAHATN